MDTSLAHQVRIIAKQQTHIKRNKFAHVMCDANRNTAVAVYMKIRISLIRCSTMRTTCHIARKATVFLF